MCSNCDYSLGAPKILARYCEYKHLKMEQVSMKCRYSCTKLYVVGQSSRTHRIKSATYLIAEYHRGRLQSTPLGKLCTDASA